jgi:hypothetical protein
VNRASSFVVGFVVALATSGAILAARLSEGSVRAALIGNAIVTIVAIACMRAVRRRALSEIDALVQAVGAFAGVLVAHAWAHHLATQIPWLCERPAQLVNDCVAATAVLGIIWAAARDLDWRWLTLSLAIVTAYHATSAHWHLDRAPHAFTFTVQQVVVAEALASAVALAVFHALASKKSTAAP